MSATAMQRPEDATGHAVVVHYHEIGLKGRNRGWFERALVRNLSDAVAGCPTGGVESLTGRLLVRTPEPPSEAVLRAIGSTFGVAAYAPARIVSADLDTMSRTALDLLSGVPFETFAIASRRATKETAFSSRDINVRLGADVQAATGTGVNLDDPDATVHVDVVRGRALLYVDRRLGPGGLPVGVSGRVVSLLSGGIDSPVATFRMAKRGARPILVHFHSAPFTDTSSARKAAELAGILARWTGPVTLYQVAFGQTQQGIVTAAPPALRVVLYRRFMVRIGAEIARRERAQALVTGDSLGQVASQTLENMVCVEDASPLPILRPLIGTDKQEIVDESRAIGTYETSILPYADCCSLFVPRHPATRAGVDECRAAEADLDVAGIVAGCVAEAEVTRIQRPACGGG